MSEMKFYGEINGVAFDDVKNYNEYMTQLIKEGVSINARSETKSKLQSPIKKDDPKKFPGFKGGDLIGRVVSEDNDMTDVNLSELLEAMNEEEKDILASMDDWKLSEILNYKKNVKDIEKELDKVESDSSKSLQILESNIAELEKKRSIMANTLYVAATLKDFYRDYYTTISNVYINASEPKCDCDGGCDCDGECNCDKKCSKCTCKLPQQEVTYEIKNTLTGLEKLAKTIGLI